MKYVRRLTILGLGFLSFHTFASDHGGAKATPAHWSYSGEEGPSHWGDLQTDFQTCKTGKSQSPVDLRWNKPKSDGDLAFNYKPSHFKILDNGHTIQVNFDHGNHAIIRGHDYELVQMHFHSDSEHTISSKSFPLELHFVHKDEAGKLAVVGVMFEDGVKNPLIDQLWSRLPTEKNIETEVTDLTLNPKELLPPKWTYYHYMGSLTTPPCTEGVNWNVLNTPVSASAEQVRLFRTLYAGNNRPIQSLNGRKPANF